MEQYGCDAAEAFDILLDLAPPRPRKRPQDRRDDTARKRNS